MAKFLSEAQIFNFYQTYVHNIFRLMRCHSKDIEAERFRAFGALPPVLAESSHRRVLNSQAPVTEEKENHHKWKTVSVLCDLAKSFRKHIRNQ